MTGFRMDRFTWQEGDLTPVSEGEGDEMANPLDEAPNIESELDDIESEVGAESEPTEAEPTEDTAHR